MCIFYDSLVHDKLTSLNYFWGSAQISGGLPGSAVISVANAIYDNGQLAFHYKVKFYVRWLNDYSPFKQ